MEGVKSKNIKFFLNPNIFYDPQNIKLLSRVIYREPKTQI